MLLWIPQFIPLLLFISVFSLGNIINTHWSTVSTKKYFGLQILVFNWNYVEDKLPK